MQTKEDLLVLLNFVRPEIFPDVTFLFTMPQMNRNISYHTAKAQSNIQAPSYDFDLLEKLGAKIYGRRYTTFQVKKKSGSYRTIHAPNKGLKAILKCLNFILQAIHTPHKNAMGFVPGKSIVDNARKHEDQNYVYNIDLKDFFPSVDQARVRGRLMVAPFHLNTTNERKRLSSIIAILCCNSMEVERWDDVENKWVTRTENVLPQGAPTSPTITNMICERMDIQLSKLAAAYNCKYSRYADDITFSSMHNVYQKDSQFIISLNEIIKAQNFHIQEPKTRLQKRGYRQEVTGLTVNEKVNVDQRYVKELRHWIYLWERYGYDKATALFAVKYHQSKGHVKQGKPKIENVIWGKLEYLKMVKGAKNSTYVLLKTRYDALVGGGSADINAMLDIWEEEGIEAAMHTYNDKIVSKKIEAEIQQELIVL